MKIEHSAIYVKDLEKTKEFFIKYFNAKASNLYHNTTTGFMSYFLSFEGDARLEIMKSKEVNEIDKPLNRTGFAHIAFSVGSKENVDELTERLVKDGYRLVSGPRNTGDGYYESCILDSEQNQIEITI